MVVRHEAARLAASSSYGVARPAAHHGPTAVAGGSLGGEAPLGWSLVYATPWIALWAVRVALGRAGIVWMLSALIPLPFGYLQTVRAKRHVERWERGTPPVTG